MVIENTIPNNRESVLDRTGPFLHGLETITGRVLEGVLGWKKSLSHSLETMTGHVLEGVLGLKGSLSQGFVSGGLRRIDAKTRLLLGTAALGIVLTTACNFDRGDSRWNPVGYVSLEPGLVLCEGEYIVNSLGHDGIHLKVESEEEGEDEKIWYPEESGLYCSDKETMYSIIRTRGSDRSYYPEAPHQRLDIFKRSYRPKR